MVHATQIAVTRRMGLRLWTARLIDYPDIREAAKCLEVSYPDLMGFEAGRGLIPEDIVQRMAALYRVPLEFLLAGTWPQKQQTLPFGQLEESPPAQE